MSVEVGQTIRIKQSGEGRGSRKEKFTVIQIYPNCVVALDKNGHRRGFSVGDLIINKVMEPYEKLI